MLRNPVSTPTPSKAAEFLSWGTSAGGPPLGFKGGSYNLYEFVGNNPTNFVDPSGLTAKHIRNYRAATPDVPLDWKIHHTKQQKLRDRYMKEKGIDVDDAKHLVAIPEYIHEDINYAQGIWARDKMREMGILKAGETLNNDNSTKAYRDFWARVSLDDVDAFEKKLEKKYSKLWARAGSDAKRFRAINDITCGGKRMRLFQSGRDARMADLFPHLAKAFGILSVIGASYTFAHTISGGHTPEQQDAWDDFWSKYTIASNLAMTQGVIGQNATEELTSSIVSYLQAIGVDETSVAIVHKQLRLYASDK